LQLHWATYSVMVFHRSSYKTVYLNDTIIAQSQLPKTDGPAGKRCHRSRWKDVCLQSWRNQTASICCSATETSIEAETTFSIQEETKRSSCHCLQYVMFQISWAYESVDLAALQKCILIRTTGEPTGSCKTPLICHRSVRYSCSEVSARRHSLVIYLPMSRSDTGYSRMTRFFKLFHLRNPFSD
jgi:hypothetical protein